MKIVLCHTYYQQRGGEDESFDAEARLLQDHGHDVVLFTRSNDELATMSRWQAARATIWNREVSADFRALLKREQPEVVHCTNTFPLLSPAIYHAAKAEGAAVVQSLRNYRLLCPGALFLRGGRICEDCLGKRVPWPGIIHGCYRDSRAATAVVAAMVTAQRALGTWDRRVDRYFTLSEFARGKFIQGGIPAERLAVKPNFVAPDPGAGDGRGGYAVFVGRLSAEKGIPTLLDAWRELGRDIPLRIVGDGPLAEMVRAAAAVCPGIDWLGRRPLGEVLDILGQASVLVMTSTWYETFGRTIIEAFAKGTPAIVPRLGSMAELVEDGVTGLHFTPGSATDLVARMRALLGDSSRLAQFRIEARRAYETHYAPERNHGLLLDIYADALAARDAETRSSSPNGAKYESPGQRPGMTARGTPQP